MPEPTSSCRALGGYCARCGVLVGLGGLRVIGAEREIVARDKANLDISWLKDDSLEDLDKLHSPDVMAREIVEELTAHYPSLRLSPRRSRRGWLTRAVDRWSTALTGAPAVK